VRVRAVRRRGGGVPGVRVRQEWQRLRQLFVIYAANGIRVGSRLLSSVFLFCEFCRDGFVMWI
jgi:hypothetical protein